MDCSQKILYNLHKIYLKLIEELKRNRWNKKERFDSFQFSHTLRDLFWTLSACRLRSCVSVIASVSLYVCKFKYMFLCNCATFEIYAIIHFVSQIRLGILTFLTEDNDKNCKQDKECKKKKKNNEKCLRKEKTFRKAIENKVGLYVSRRF